MLKYAAAFWGIKKVENFDPVVKLMLEALANEVYTLGEDFTAIETRLLEKTAHILTPGMLASPFPAHGIVHASPIDPEYMVTGTDIHSCPLNSESQDKMTDFPVR